MASSRLNLHERYRIHALYEAGFTIRTIALMLGRAPSTISREVRRNRTGRRYQPNVAHQLMQQRRTRASRRRRIDAERIRQIEALLAEDHSPAQIAGRTGLASHEWIYQYIYADQRRGGMLFKQLRRRRRKCRKRGLRDGRGQLLHRRHWSTRPAVVETRSRIVGWRVSRTMQTDFVLDALEQALFDRQPAIDDLIHHSDRGSQYVSIRYTERLEQAGIKPSVGSKWDSYDNALAETINGLYKAELIHHRGPWKNRESVALATLQWVHWFNHTRLLKPIGGIPPAEAEANYWRQREQHLELAATT